MQDDPMPPGTRVTLRGVVVTAIDNFGGKMGDIWVDEPEGGTFSGVHVFGAATTDVGGSRSATWSIAVKDEFDYMGSVAARVATPAVAR